MGFKLRVVTTTTEQEIDLRKLPMRLWPEQAKALITYEMLKQAKLALQPKDYLVNRIEQVQAAKLSFDQYIQEKGI